VYHIEIKPENILFRTYKAVRIFFIAMGLQLVLFLGLLIASTQNTILHQASFIICAATIVVLLGFIINTLVYFKWYRYYITSLSVEKNKLRIIYLDRNTSKDFYLNLNQISLRYAMPSAKGGYRHRLLEIRSDNIKLTQNTCLNWTPLLVTQVFEKLKELKNEPLTKAETKLVSNVGKGIFAHLKN